MRSSLREYEPIAARDQPIGAWPQFPGKVFIRDATGETDVRIFFNRPNARGDRIKPALFDPERLIETFKPERVEHRSTDPLALPEGTSLSMTPDPPRPGCSPSPCSVHRASGRCLQAPPSRRRPLHGEGIPREASKEPPRIQPGPEGAAGESRRGDPATTAPAPNSDVLEVASGGGNVWVVTRDPIVVGRWRLLHHHTGMEGQHARISRALQSRPIAIAARDDEVLVAMPSSPVPGKEIDLLSLTVQQDPTMGNFYELPLDSWKVLANIPSDRPFKGLALGPAGPQVLLVPRKPTRAEEPWKPPRASRTTHRPPPRAASVHLARAPPCGRCCCVPATCTRHRSGPPRSRSRPGDSAPFQRRTFDLGIDFADVDRVCQTATRLGFAARGSKALLELGSSVARTARRRLRGSARAGVGLGAVEEDPW